MNGGIAGWMAVIFRVEVLLSAVPWQGQRILHVTWRDVRQRKQNESAKSQAASVFENAQEGVTITDAEERILRVESGLLPTDRL